MPTETLRTYHVARLLTQCVDIFQARRNEDAAALAYRRDAGPDSLIALSGARARLTRLAADYLSFETECTAPERARAWAAAETALRELDGAVNPTL